METRLLIYDDHCPLCRWYSNLFVKKGFLTNEGRIPFSKLPAQLEKLIDTDRSRNEIPYLDIPANKVYYGIDALLEILGRKYPLIKSIGRFPVFHFLLRKLYSLVSFNRKLIVAKKCGSGEFDCSPELNYTYRFLFLFLAFAGSTLLLVPIHEQLLNNHSFYTLSLLELEIVHLSVCLVNVFLCFTLKKTRAIEYIGQVAVLSLCSLLMIVPLLMLNLFLPIPSWVLLGCFSLIALVIYREYIRRMEYAGILNHHRWVAAANLTCMMVFLIVIFK